jgi:hypothetical protein
LIATPAVRKATSTLEKEILSLSAASRGAANKKNTRRKIALCFIRLSSWTFSYQDSSEKDSSVENGHRFGEFAILPDLRG